MYMNVRIAIKTVISFGPCIILTKIITIPWYSYFSDVGVKIWKYADDLHPSMHWDLQSTHLLNFGFCHVASLYISRSFQFPDHIFAFLMGCASKFATKNNLLNFVPPLHEFIWLSDARIQIKWLWPTLSSHSFLDDLFTFIYYDSPTNQ